MLERRLDRRGAVGDGRDDLDLLAHAEHQLERLAEDLVVLDEHDPHGLMPAAYSAPRSSG